MSDENSTDDKVFLLLDCEDGNQTFADGVALDAIVSDVWPSMLPPKVQTGYLFDENADANSLALQKWGVIVPEGDRGKELFGFISDLVAWREKEQGPKVVPFQVKPDMDAAAAQDWVVNTLSAIDKDERPRYLLILGDLHEVSAELQLALSTRYFVGRLAFSDEADYRAYVEKVIESEKNGPTLERGKALVYVVRRNEFPAQKAIEDAENNLITPLLTKSNERYEKGKIPVKFDQKNESAPSSASKDDFLKIVRDAPVSSLLLSVSHGKGANPDKPEAERRTNQGALCFDDKTFVTAEDVRDGKFLPRGFWFLFACYGAGTPKRSAYQHWGSQGNVSCLPKEGENPYIAALPKAALANPEGPLAIVGHLDLAWVSSYSNVAGFRNQPTRFADLADIANKKAWRRVGPIFGDFIRDLVDINSKITNTIDAEKAGSSPSMTIGDRTRLWMLRQDLAAYILLGDPAAYLPFPRNVPPPARADSSDDNGAS